MREWIFIFVLFLPIFANAAGDRAHLRFSVKRFDFVCEQERDIPLSELIVLCDGKRLRLRAKVDRQKDATNMYMVKGWIEDIDPSGKTAIVSAPQILATAGEESEISTGSSNGLEIDFKVTITP